MSCLQSSRRKQASSITHRVSWGFVFFSDSVNSFWYIKTPHRHINNTIKLVVVFLPQGDFKLLYLFTCYWSHEVSKWTKTWTGLSLYFYSFLLVNSVALHGDHCPICQRVEKELYKLSHALNCSIQVINI